MSVLINKNIPLAVSPSDRSALASSNPLKTKSGVGFLPPKPIINAELLKLGSQNTMHCSKSALKLGAGPVVGQVVGQLPGGQVVTAALAMAHQEISQDNRVGNSLSVKRIHVNSEHTPEDYQVSPGREMMNRLGSDLWLRARNHETYEEMKGREAVNEVLIGAAAVAAGSAVTAAAGVTGPLSAIAGMGAEKTVERLGECVASKFRKSQQTTLLNEEPSRKYTNDLKGIKAKIADMQTNLQTAGARRDREAAFLATTFDLVSVAKDPEMEITPLKHRLLNDREFVGTGNLGRVKKLTTSNTLVLDFSLENAEINKKIIEQYGALREIDKAKKETSSIGSRFNTLSDEQFQELSNNGASLFQVDPKESRANKRYNAEHVVKSIMGFTRYCRDSANKITGELDDATKDKQVDSSESRGPKKEENGTLVPEQFIVARIKAKQEKDSVCVLISVESPQELESWKKNFSSIKQCTSNPTMKQKLLQKITKKLQRKGSQVKEFKDFGKKCCKKMGKIANWNSVKV